MAKLMLENETVDISLDTVYYYKSMILTEYSKDNLCYSYTLVHERIRTLTAENFHVCVLRVL